MAPKKKNVVLGAIQKKKNPLIYNPHNPNHTHGNVKRKFLFDPYARVFNVDSDTPAAATAPVNTLPRQPPRPKRMLLADQPNSSTPSSLWEEPMVSSITLEKRPMDRVSRVIPVPGHTRVTNPNRTSNDLVGFVSSHARAPSIREPILRTAGQHAENTFPTAIGSDIPITSNTYHTTETKLLEPVAPVRPQSKGKGKQKMVTVNMREANRVMNAPYASASNTQSKIKRAIIASEARGKVVDSVAKRAREKVVDSVAKKSRDRALDSMASRARNKAVDSMAKNLRKKVVASVYNNKHDKTVDALRKLVVESTKPNYKVTAVGKKRRIKK